MTNKTESLISRPYHTNYSFNVFVSREACLANRYADYLDYFYKKTEFKSLTHCGMDKKIWQKDPGSGWGTHNIFSFTEDKKNYIYVSVKKICFDINKHIHIKKTKITCSNIYYNPSQR